MSRTTRGSAPFVMFSRSRIRRAASSSSLAAHTRSTTSCLRSCAARISSNRASRHSASLRSRGSTTPSSHRTPQHVSRPSAGHEPSRSPHTQAWAWHGKQQLNALTRNLGYRTAADAWLHAQPDEPHQEASTPPEPPRPPTPAPSAHPSSAQPCGRSPHTDRLRPCGLDPALK
jgi:hypothetical protein